MVYMVRTIRHQAGKAQEAFQWAVKVATYLNERYPEMNIEVLRNINGFLDYVHWAVRYESLAVFEEVGNKLDEDTGYQDLLAETEGMFVGSSLEDNLYATVP